MPNSLLNLINARRAVEYKGGTFSGAGRRLEVTKYLNFPEMLVVIA